MLTLLDWRRQVADLYASVRRQAVHDPERAHRMWLDRRSALYAEHPESPVADRAAFTGLACYPYDESWRFEVEVCAAAPQRLTVRSGTGEAFALNRLGIATFPWGALDVHWIEAYGGGVFLPVHDGTSGTTTYGGGRYVLDTVKGADLGGQDARLVVDFNFAYAPSCAFDARWSCPLAPPGNRVPVAIVAGERIVGPS